MVIDGGNLDQVATAPMISPIGGPEFLQSIQATTSRTHQETVDHLAVPFKEQFQDTEITDLSRSQPATELSQPSTSTSSPTCALTQTTLTSLLETNTTESQASIGSGSASTDTSRIANSSTSKPSSGNSSGKEDERSNTGMFMWTPELVSVLVECYVTSMRDAGVGAQKKRIYEQVAKEMHARTAVSVTAEQIGNKIKFMRKQHMAVKAMLMSNRHVPGAKMTPHFKALDEVFSKDNTSAPLNRALEKCLGGKVKVIQPNKGVQSGSNSAVNPTGSIVVVQHTAEERNSLGSAFSQYVAKLIDELSEEQRDEVQEHILSYIFGVKQQSREQQSNVTIGTTISNTTS